MVQGFRCPLESIRRIHRLVGNAATEGRYIVVGTGSSQLVQTVLYALSSDSPHPLSVVCAAPYYSCYPELAGILKSELYKWEGDAHTFNKDGPFLELVTSPNNPDGSIRGPVVRPPAGGHVMYDLAYYWPQFTPITHQADHDIMLFTFSKSVGHAGSRIGWAIVKNKEIAIKMVKLIEVLSIGVSKEAQLRATKILGAICDGYEGSLAIPESDKFFDYFRRIMAERWNKLREVVKKNQVFSLPEYQQEHCLFSEGLAGTHPGFAWLKCEKGESKDDAEGFLKGHGIQARGGHKFGVDGSFVRVSMLSRENTFKAFLERLSAIEAGGDSTYKKGGALVGNAATEGRYIVVGTGSTQLVQAVLYALSSDSSHPLSVLCAAPYYSFYPELVDILKSGLYKWEGDAHTFNKDGPFVELVTSPNNPDGSIRGPVVRQRDDGHVVYDLAYYWPQFTAITHQADHDIMLFTFSKSTGHAGSRIGWAILRNKETAARMVKLIDVLSVGVCDGFEVSSALPEPDRFFHYFRHIMTERWNKLREAVKKNEVFSLPEYQQEHCLFSKGLAGMQPGFAWLKCEVGESKEEAEGLLKGHNIQARGGRKFGVDGSFVRVSMLSRENTFKAFLERLSAIGAGKDITHMKDGA
ncbi:hypothetical protein SAY87_013372 [Trapa incisa]|uniref:Alliinase C-terminal domain-containing protein n=1 Tax=Trapa incisa TaxID=236973 RepID=A0AAN7KEY8_9MYRT|nr:hypothetical protein SAY87_013372 [Trapa incisa]